MRQHYYGDDTNLRRAGAAAGNLWRFIREMGIGDLVVVPHGPEFYVAQVDGPARHIAELVGEDTAFRRDVTWLNGKCALPRGIALAALQSRMKTQGTCAYATDLVEEIQDALSAGTEAELPNLQSDLRHRLTREALQELRSGRLDGFGFERFLVSLLHQLGASDLRHLAPAQDKGADIVATFRVAGAAEVSVAAQAKHFQSEPPVGAAPVQQLIEGIEAESADLGMLITTGDISDEAVSAAAEYFEEKGTKIQLVDGNQLASLVVEVGLAPVESASYSGQ